MTPPPLRRLTLADLAILIAGSAVALMLWRMVHDNQWLELLRKGESRTIDLAPFLLSASVTILVARMIGPRPLFRRLVWQPGAIACLAFLASFALHSVLPPIHSIQLIIPRGASPPVNDLGIVFLISRSLKGGGVVATAWATLAIAGRWRPEPTWIDRSGRILGLMAIIVWIASSLL